MNRRRFIEQSSWWLAMAGSVAQGATTETYKEVISSVLITENGKKLVVTTSQYHYIFDAPPALVRTLKEKFHPYVTATFSDFHVSSSGKTVGTTTLAIANAPHEALEEAIAAGFVRSADGAAFTTSLNGQRYRAGGVKPTAQYKLNNSYEINVVSEQSESRTRITPIQVVGGVLVLAGVALFALMVFGSCAVHGTLGTSACHE
jgi:hypothetical protein